MNSGWPNQRFIDARRSTLRTTAASYPIPVWKQKNRPLTRPSPIGRMSRAAMPLANRSTAAIGSFGRPSVRANTFVDPPGSTPSAASVPAIAGRHLVERAVAAVADDDVEPAPCGVGRVPRGVAAPVGLDDLDVVARVRAGRWTTTVLRAVTDDANELTTSRIRTA